MEVIAYTASSAFRSFIHGVYDQPIKFSTVNHSDTFDPACLHLLHLSSLDPQQVRDLLKNHAGDCSFAICSDRPNIDEMLEYVQAGAKAYCNSFMQSTHYQQLLRLLAEGQSWFPPHLLVQTFSLAQRAVNGTDRNKLEALTAREKDVALSVSKGLSNREIAEHYHISERTVKTHLTNIFKKLQIKDRVGLVLYLK
jgi:DNA-binding NarL/FixJ family response regulator